LKILGISCDFHDAAAAIVVDGKVIAASEEERFSRIKHDPALPRETIKFCLEQANLKPEDLDALVFYERPFLKFSRIIKSLRADSTGLKKAISHWGTHGKFEIKDRLYEFLGNTEIPYFEIDHHSSHAASAYYCSPFEEATVITLDGVGEYETATISKAKKGVLSKLNSLNMPHSIGLFYSAFTSFLGFEVNEGEYKVMGMAAYGKPVHVDKIRQLYSLLDNGLIKFDLSYFNFATPFDTHYTKKFVQLLGKPRTPESDFIIKGEDGQFTGNNYANLAASVQSCTEEIILHVVDSAIKRTGEKNVCLAGGVALNSAANGRLIRELGTNLYVHPASGDSGGALGAALLHFHKTNPRTTHKPMVSPFLGIGFTAHEVEKVLVTREVSFTHYEDEDELLDFLASNLKQGCVAGWFHGRAEWGPRSLGSRSIIADPGNPNIQQIVNSKIKFREPFRPFAPSVPEDLGKEYFELLDPTEHASQDHFASSPEHYMLAIAQVKEKYLGRFPAITHVDNTARVQLVSQAISPRFYKMLLAMRHHTGYPMLLNTSFNLRGEPIVNSPTDALRTFEKSDMDYLVMENFLISKTDD
tara:strand:- start:14607 stop:16361 length:1755 start_codon:yes stop_codon:yes gene_type:complete